MLPHNLPTYVSIPDIRGESPNGKANWSNGFLPAKHQAILMAAHQPIRNLSQPEAIGQEEEQGTRELLKFLNERHAALRPEESDLQARIGTYELAGRMQLSSPEVSDFKSEPRHIHQLYGTDSKNEMKASYARNCLLSRRLLERGVRYVNLYCGSRASGVDGLLNWDAHNPDGFTLWMMGGGVKGGVSYGATDDFGRRAEVNPTSIWEFYSTVLHILGLDYQRLSWYHNGLDRRLTDVHGHVIKEVLA